MKKFLSGFIVGALIVVTGALVAQTRSALTVGVPVTEFSVTNFPLYGAVATQSDTGNYSVPVSIRADTAGEVTVTCWGQGAEVSLTNSITVNLVAGEFAPCQIKRLWDTNTDAITIHQFW